MTFWIQIAIAVATLIISYLIRPKPKKEKPPEVQELKLPTAEAGKPIPVLFGRMKVRSPNVLWFGHKATRS